MAEDSNKQNLELNDEAGRLLSPPYISFMTFYNCLDWLMQEGIPLKIDRSIWSQKYSGSLGPQVIASLRFLQLLKEDSPQPILDTIVKSKGEERKRLLRKIIQNSYSTVAFDDLPRATPNMLAQWFHPYNLDGSTLRKAISFFINACKTAEIPLSKALQKKARNKPSKASGTKEKARMKEKAAPVNTRLARPYTPFDHSNSPDSQSGQVNKVQLASGGEVTLTMSIDLFSLSKEDREFVLQLVDLMKDYGKKK